MHTDCAQNNLHYLLGRNCLGISWVTQLGSRLSSIRIIGSVWPTISLRRGQVYWRMDQTPIRLTPLTKALLRQPPMRIYVDDERAYSSNEPIISCNAPLVFMLAAMHTR